MFIFLISLVLVIDSEAPNDATGGRSGRKWYTSLKWFNLVVRPRAAGQRLTHCWFRSCQQPDKTKCRLVPSDPRRGVTALSWGRWRWLTGSASGTPDTAYSSSSASWRRRSTRWGAQFARERCSHSLAVTDRWDRGQGTTPAAATLPRRCGPVQGPSEAVRWEKLGEAPGSQWRRRAASRRRRKAGRKTRGPGSRTLRGRSLTGAAFWLFYRLEHRSLRSPPHLNLQETQPAIKT